jgi:hypothetical protein
MTLGPYPHRPVYGCPFTRIANDRWRTETGHGSAPLIGVVASAGASGGGEGALGR